ncbi:P-loop containing nucleoside triphosphate hydrolase protein, partial [Leptodontidium sp. 2 PMI_412]
HIIVLFGPSGCGKSTVGEHLQEKCSFEFLEGDKYHSKDNVEKIKSGTTLNDLDRAMWLRDLSTAATTATSDHEVVIVSCSALKRNYRRVFRSAQHEDSKIRLHFLFLQMSEEKAEMLVEQRQQRNSHYMPKSSVRSQFEILEIP